MAEEEKVRTDRYRGLIESASRAANAFTVGPTDESERERDARARRATEARDRYADYHDAEVGDLHPRNIGRLLVEDSVAGATARFRVAVDWRTLVLRFGEGDNTSDRLHALRPQRAALIETHTDVEAALGRAIAAQDLNSEVPGTPESVSSTEAATPEEAIPPEPRRSIHVGASMTHIEWESHSLNLTTLLGIKYISLLMVRHGEEVDSIELVRWSKRGNDPIDAEAQHRMDLLKEKADLLGGDGDAFLERVAQDELKKSADSVRAAINRAIDSIRKELPALADDLHQAILTGNRLRYGLPDSPRWGVSSPVLPLDF